jgi:hypothetical protein
MGVRSEQSALNLRFLRYLLFKKLKPSGGGV